MNWKTNIKEYRVHLILALIAAIFVTYCIEPIMSFLGKLFLYFGVEISAFWLDKVYRKIATGNIDDSLLIETLFLFLFGYSAIIMSFVVFPRQRREAKDYFERRKRLLGLITDTTESNKDILTRQAELLNRERKFNKSSKALGIILKIVACAFFIEICWTCSENVVKQKTIVSFNQDIKILTPYILPSQKDTLISNFSAMQNYADYKRLSAKIDIIAKKKGIILPRVRF